MTITWVDPTVNVTVLTGIPQATLLQYLADAQAAYAMLSTGGRIVSVSYEGKSVTYTQGNIAQLMNWIMMLQRALGMGGIGRRAIRPYFR